MTQITDTLVFSIMLEEAINANYEVTADMFGDLDFHDKDELDAIDNYGEQLKKTAKFLELLNDPTRAKNKGTNVATWQLTLEEHEYLRYIVTQYHTIRNEDPAIEKVFAQHNIPTYNNN